MLAVRHGPAARDPRTGIQVRIGVMGSAGGDVDPGVANACRALGRAIAERGCCLLTGACQGLSHNAVLEAKETHGHVVGISPASTLKEHVEPYSSPYREYDILIFTGMGLTGRELININTSDIIVIVGHDERWSEARGPVDGQLSDDEDVGTGGDGWRPLGTSPAEQITGRRIGGGGLPTCDASAVLRAAIEPPRHGAPVARRRAERDR